MTARGAKRGVAAIMPKRPDTFDIASMRASWDAAAARVTAVEAHRVLHHEGRLVPGGFTLRALKEPEPSPEALASRSQLEDASRGPYFLLLDFTCCEV